MNCFNHRDVPAVGLCKSCLKGLCPDCAVEIVNGLACKGACEERASRINRAMDNNSEVINVARRQSQSSGKLSVLFGIALSVFAVWAVFEFSARSSLPYLFGTLAAMSLITGLLRLSRSQQYPTIDDDGRPR